MHSKRNDQGPSGVHFARHSKRVNDGRLGNQVAAVVAKRFDAGRLLDLALSANEQSRRS